MQMHAPGKLPTFQNILKAFRRTQVSAHDTMTGVESLFVDQPSLIDDFKHRLLPSLTAAAHSRSSNIFEATEERGPEVSGSAKGISEGTDLVSNSHSQHDALRATQARQPPDREYIFKSQDQDVVLYMKRVNVSDVRSGLALPGAY